MRHLAAVAVAASTLGALGACGPRPGPGPAEQAPVARAATPSTDPVDGVMRRKVEHAQNLVVAMARGDLEQVHDTAAQLYDISRQAEWMVHDTVTYTVFSERFRQVVAAMTEHAQQQDLDAVTADFSQMMSTCVECHTYLRRERLSKDYPGKISMVEPAGIPVRLGRAG
jgi:cytochrome c556